jgi:hypothetical protein
MGGVFYTAYRSTVEISNSQITSNFAVVGAVGYANNDGILIVRNNTVLSMNQALNTCLFFLINTKEQSLIQNVMIT